RLLESARRYGCRTSFSTLAISTIEFRRFRYEEEKTQPGLKRRASRFFRVITKKFESSIEWSLWAWISSLPSPSQVRRTRERSTRRFSEFLQESRPQRRSSAPTFECFNRLVKSKSPL